MNLKIVSDTHIFGADQLNYDVLAEMLDPNTILLGDIVDRKNCLKQNIDVADKLYSRLKARWGDQYRTGNHEVMDDVDNVLFLPCLDNQGCLNWKSPAINPDRIAVCHGDRVKYGDLFSIKERAKDGGAGKFERMWKKKFSQLRKYVDFNEKDVMDMEDTFQRFAARFNIHTLIVGHFHPNRLLDVKLTGVRVIVVPRGASNITV